MNPTPDIKNLLKQVRAQRTDLGRFLISDVDFNRWLVDAGGWMIGWSHRLVDGSVSAGRMNPTPDIQNLLKQVIAGRTDLGRFFISDIDFNRWRVDAGWWGIGWRYRLVRVG